MSNVEVLLQEHVHKLGRCGDIVKVAAGHARNFLIPKGLAVRATSSNIKFVERRKSALEAEEAALAAETAAAVSALDGLVVRTVEKSDENGHLFGSVNAGAVALLLKSAGHGIEERQVRLEHPIKQVGSHHVEIHVRGDATAEITVEVTSPNFVEAVIEPSTESTGGGAKAPSAAPEA